MTSEEERAVAALSGGLPPRRTRKPSGAAFGLAFGQPAWMKPPPDPAARAARIATGAEGPGGANYLARLEGLAAGGKVPSIYADEGDDNPPSYDPLVQSVREYENNDNGLYADNGNSNGNIPAPAPSSGQQALLLCMAALFKGIFNVDVPPPAGDEETFFRGCIGPLTEAVCARYGAAGRPGDPLAEARLPKLPLLLAEQKRRTGKVVAEGTPETRESAPQWQQTTAGAPKGLR